MKIEFKRSGGFSPLTNSSGTVNFSDSGAQVISGIWRHAVQDLSVAPTGGDVLPGEGYLENTPVLEAHAGTQPDLFMRWNRVPLSADMIDVVVFLPIAISASF